MRELVEPADKRRHFLTWQFWRRFYKIDNRLNYKESKVKTWTGYSASINQSII